MVFTWMTNLKVKFLYDSCSKSAGDYNQLGGREIVHCFWQKTVVWITLLSKVLSRPMAYNKSD